jgi:hypothetical protein
MPKTFYSPTVRRWSFILLSRYTYLGVLVLLWTFISSIASKLDSGPWLTSFIFVVFDILVAFGGNNTNLSRLLLLIRRLVSKVTAALWANTANAPHIPLSSSPLSYPFLIGFLSSVPIISYLLPFQLLLVYRRHHRSAGTEGVGSTMSGGGLPLSFWSRGTFMRWLKEFFTVFMRWPPIRHMCRWRRSRSQEVSKRMLLLVRKWRKSWSGEREKLIRETSRNGWCIWTKVFAVFCHLYSIALHPMTLSIQICMWSNI